VPLDSLKNALAPVISKEKTELPTIVINADKTVAIDEVVAVMRIAKELGARTVLSVEKQ
jgi:biopolymer transport protein ExbD